MARTNETPNPDETVTIPAAQLNTILGRLAELEDAVTSAKASGDVGLTGKLAAALERLSESTITSAQIQAEATARVAMETKKAHRPSNEVVPMISVFNRRGETLPDYTKPKLKCRMLIPWLVEDDSCTREEVELLNLVQPGDYHIRRIDRSMVTCSVTIALKNDHVTPSVLVLTHETGFNNDNFQLMPALTDMLRFILKQHKDDITRALADAVLTDEEEEALIQAGSLSVSQ